MSNRSEVLTAFKARLAAITVANGYATDAGQDIAIGVIRRVGRDDAPAAIAMIVGDDNPRFQGEQILVALPVHVLVIADTEGGDAWDRIEALLEDVKIAVELSDRRFGKRLREDLARGATRTLEREPGSTVVGVSVTYVLTYAEVWGAP